MDYKEFAINLAKEAGEIIKKNFKLGMKKEWKSDNTPVTETDFKINRLVIDSVKKHFPTHSVLAEEGNNLQDGSEYTWVCDPLDGTIPFSHGIPTCVFSLALVKNGEPILGVIYDPFMDRMFFAEKDKGTFLNGAKVSVSKKKDLEKSVIGAGVAKRDVFGVNKAIFPLKEEDAKVMNLLSICYMGMLVASGEFVAAIFSHTSAHDLAALKIIVEEAGGKVTDLFGKDQRYDRPIKGGLMSNGLVHKKILDIIEKSRSK